MSITSYDREIQLHPESYRQTLNNIHYKYNFIIEPVNNNETFRRESYLRIYKIYPNYIDLTSNKTVIIKIFNNKEYSNKNSEDYNTFFNHEYSSNFKLNLDASNLRCTLGFKLINCKVSKNHFRNKKSGDYYIYLEEPQNNYNRLYDIDPIYIKLPENNNDIELRIKEEYNKNIIKIENNGTLYFIIDFNDNGTNIFNQTDIEEKTKFNTTIIDDKQNIYEVICRLWKPIKENLVIICNLNDNLKNENQNITLSNTTINYNDNNIIILSEISLKVKQLSYKIPFIYSDHNYIHCSIYGSNIEIFELKFKYDFNEIKINSFRIKL